MAKAAESASGQKMFSADCVSVLLMALGNTTISRAQLDMMSALDGTRTASSFEHQFRPVIAKAKELKLRADAGEKFAPVQPNKKRSTYGLYHDAFAMLTACKTDDKVTPASTPKRKSAASQEDKPPKKAKTTPKKRDTPTEELDGMSDNGFPQDADEFIKREQDWEYDFS